jgi:hypothetical protein
VSAQQPYKPGKPWLVTVIDRHGRLELHAASCPDVKGADGILRTRTARVRCVEAAMAGYVRETGRASSQTAKVMPCATGFPVTEHDANWLRDVHWSGDVPKFQQCPSGHGQQPIWMSKGISGVWTHHLNCGCSMTEADVSYVLTTWPDSAEAEAHLARLERERKAADEAHLALGRRTGARAVNPDGP